MDIRIKTTDYEMTPQAAAYIRERVAHIEKVLAQDAANARCEVEVGRDAGRPRHGANVWFAEFQIMYPGGNLVRATNNSESVNGAIDDAKDELMRQLRRERKLHIRMWRRSGALAKRLMRLGRGEG